jgi:hypothetical protein
MPRASTAGSGTIYRILAFNKHRVKTRKWDKITGKHLWKMNLSLNNEYK